MESSARSEARSWPSDFGTGTLCLAVALLALCSNPASTQAVHLGLHRCNDTNTRLYRVKDIQTNYTCRYTYGVLRDLLRSGVSRLPKPTNRVRRWGCDKAGPYHICTRNSPGAAKPGRIFFSVKRRT